MLLKKKLFFENSFTLEGMSGKTPIVFELFSNSFLFGCFMDTMRIEKKKIENKSKCLSPPHMAIPTDNWRKTTTKTPKNTLTKNQLRQYCTAESNSGNSQGSRAEIYSRKHFQLPLPLPSISGFIVVFYFSTIALFRTDLHTVSILHQSVCVGAGNGSLPNMQTNEKNLCLWHFELSAYPDRELKPVWYYFYYSIDPTYFGRDRDNKSNKQW